MIYGMFATPINPGVEYTLYELGKLRSFNLGLTETTIIATLFILLGVIFTFCIYKAFNKKTILMFYGLVPILTGVNLFTTTSGINVISPFIITNLSIQFILFWGIIRCKNKSLLFSFFGYVYSFSSISYGLSLLLQGELPANLDLYSFILFVLQLISGIILMLLLLIVENAEKGFVLLVLIVTSFTVYPLPENGEIYYGTPIVNINEIQEYMKENNYDRVMFSNSTEPEKYEDEGKLIISNTAYYQPRILLKRNYIYETKTE